MSACGFDKPLLAVLPLYLIQNETRVIFNSPKNPKPPQPIIPLNNHNDDYLFLLLTVAGGCGPFSNELIEACNENYRRGPTKLIHIIQES